ncbi:MAG TPA: FHA domain-containing protein [Pyrinomonadaceae bacterium]|jgi:predicted component of type VI protein secretion system/nitrate reductase cytochrome c-type subunit|nr:FHA domain-containing protein [Pyrinomonadaceae bacterium]
MQSHSSTFIIAREDLDVEPITLSTDGLKIGRLGSCELVLNHPSVSRLHAGINEADGRFYVFNFSHSSGITLNGRVVPVEEAEVLADGDVIQIGPFFLQLERDADSLRINVSLQMAVHVGEGDAQEETQQPFSEKGGRGPIASRAQSGEISQALNVFWEKRKRDAGKMHRLSPMRPHAPARVLGKARFNWTPTRDLVRPWPFSIFIWGFIVVATLSAAAAITYTQAFSPAPLSDAHTRASLSERPPIARAANAGSCTSCHTLNASMESNCAACHQAGAFAATITSAHREAGITCANCHGEHRGAQFQPAAAGLQACATCHSDANRKLFNGRKVSTPHGGTFGYPVAGGRWTWAGLAEEEWERKSPEMRETRQRLEEAARRWPSGDDKTERERSAQFHALHLHRVKVVEGIKGNKEGEMSCSSCHQSFTPVDTKTPRTTCGACHNGDRDGAFKNVLAADEANCISCHVQHVKGRRAWGASLIVGGNVETDSGGAAR